MKIDDDVFNSVLKILGTTNLLTAITVLAQGIHLIDIKPASILYYPKRRLWCSNYFGVKPSNKERCAAKALQSGGWLKPTKYDNGCGLSWVVNHPVLLYLICKEKGWTKLWLCTCCSLLKARQLWNCCIVSIRYEKDPSPIFRIWNVVINVFHIMQLVRFLYALPGGDLLNCFFFWDHFFMIGAFSSFVIRTVSEDESLHFLGRNRNLSGIKDKSFGLKGSFVELIGVLWQEIELLLR